MHALEKVVATHSSILAWRIPGTEEPGGLPSMGSHRVRHDWSGLAVAAAVPQSENIGHQLQTTKRFHFHLNQGRTLYVWTFFIFCLHSYLGSFPCFPIKFFYEGKKKKKRPIGLISLLRSKVSTEDRSLGFFFGFVFYFYWSIVDLQCCV